MKITKFNIFLLALVIIQLVGIICLEIRNNNIDYNKNCLPTSFDGSSVSEGGK